MQKKRKKKTWLNHLDCPLVVCTGNLSLINKLKRRHLIVTQAAFKMP